MNGRYQRSISTELGSPNLWLSPAIVLFSSLFMDMDRSSVPYTAELIRDLKFIPIPREVGYEPAAMGSGWVSTTTTTGYYADAF